MNETVSEWLKRAEGDFRTVMREMEAFDEYSYPVICVLSQQCLEKMLKAVLIHQAVDFPKIHDLEKLAKQVQTAVPNLSLSGRELDWLTMVAGTSRYPEGPVTAEDARKAYELCRTIRTELRTFFNLE